MTARRTLAGPASVSGRGLFTGAPASVRMTPAPAGNGVSMRRADIAGAPAFPATIASLAQGPAALPGRNTCLGPQGAPIMTVEHVLSALSACGITDALIEVAGPEVPILDGSAAPFVEAILAAGTRALDGNAEPLTLSRPVRVEGPGGASITATPGARAELVYELDYGSGSPIARQTAAFEPGVTDYAHAIAPARTFCLEAEARAMRDAGLFTHLGPRDMLVIGPAGPIENAYRLPEEPARHKLLDLIGDLSLVGRPVRARIVAVRSGHALAHAMCRALLAAS